LVFDVIVSFHALVVMQKSPRSPRTTSSPSLLETLCTHSTLTQDMMTGMVRLIEGAMQAGQGHARVQLLRASHCQYRYVADKSSAILSEDSMTLPIHDAQTLAPLDGGSRQRVQLARPAFDIILWLRNQGLQALCTTSALLKGRLNHEPALAPWLYVVAVFVPDAGGRLSSLWNGHYMIKCLDGTAIESWTLRLQRALEMGVAHCALSTLYLGADYHAASLLLDQVDDPALLVPAPRDHLTMQVLSDQCWVIDKRLNVLVGFARQYGYAWTLCLRSGAESPGWAYFTLLLDPLMQYEQLK